MPLGHGQPHQQIHTLMADSNPHGFFFDVCVVVLLFCSGPVVCLLKCFHLRTSQSSLNWTGWEGVQSFEWQRIRQYVGEVIAWGRSFCSSERMVEL